VVAEQQAGPDAASHDRPASRRRLVLVLGLSALLIVVLTLATLDKGDFVRYYRCGEAAFFAGGDPYACRDYFQTPPTFYLTAPFALLGSPADAIAWGLFSAVGTCAAIVVLLASFDLLDAPAGGLAMALVLSPFTLFLIAFQQISGLVFLLEALAFWLIRRGHYSGAAGLLALSVFKPHLTLILAPLLAPLPRQAQVVLAGLGSAILLPLSWPYLGNGLRALAAAGTSDLGTHSTVEFKELFDLYPGTAPWDALGTASLLVPLAYFSYQAYRLWRAPAFDLTIVARLLPAGLLWLPYNRAYDWVLAIPAYLVLWLLAGRRWSAPVLLNIGLTWIALPLSTYTYFSHIPLSINPLPLVVLIVTLERLARRYPERAAALRWALPARA